MTIVYDTDGLTVAQGSRSLTVTGAPLRKFTVRGKIGNLILNAILNENNSALLTESGDLILF